MTFHSCNIHWSLNSRVWQSITQGNVGIAVATFSSASNGAPEKPFTAIRAYQAIGGLTTISGTVCVVNSNLTVILYKGFVWVLE